MKHLTAADLDRIRRGSAPAGQAAAFGSHIAACADCAALVDESLALREGAMSLDAAFGGERDHLDDDEVIAFAERSMDDVTRAEVAAHLAKCSICRSEVADLRPWIESQKRRSYAPYAIGAAVAALVLVVLAGVVMERDPSDAPLPRVRTTTAMIAPLPVKPPPVVTTPAPRALRPQWTALLARTRRTGVLPFPADVRELAGDDAFRGDPPSDVAAPVWPAATAVQELRPAFTWPPSSGARYVVTLSRDGTVIERSSVLAEPRWQPRTRLTRGAMYRWQVDVEAEDETFVLPAPPAPPAVFRIVGQDEHEELEAAERDAPDDHLLRGLLYARAGVVHEARRELQASRDPIAKRLLSQLPPAR
jgi:hypothetical protein